MTRPRLALAGGALLAVATLLKLHCLFVVPFLVVRRRWRTIGGFAACGLLLLAIGVAIDGFALTRGYLTDELPRISRFGERGSAEMRLPDPRLDTLRRMLATGETVIDGERYRVEYFTFALNASIVRTPLGRAAWNLLRRVWPGAAPAQVAWLFLAALWVLLAVWQRRFGLPDDAEPNGGFELIYWQAVLIAVLLAAPVSWVMGTVWLLPMAVIVAAEIGRGGSRLRLWATTACATGILLAAIPDPPDPLATYRLVAAELVCLAGLLGLWSARRLS